jgi:hypothetical protein
VLKAVGMLHVPAVAAAHAAVAVTAAVAAPAAAAGDELRFVVPSPSGHVSAKEGLALAALVATSAAPRYAILARVLLGRVNDVTTHQPRLRRPPPGYDSIVGRAVPGAAQELCVYDRTHWYPVYVVAYTT